MKTWQLAAVCLLAFAGAAAADPHLNSWFTDRCGVYARLYKNDTDAGSNISVTTWSLGEGVQDPATYAGVHEVSYTDDFVYVRTTGLSSHVMGPFYDDTDRLVLPEDWPANACLVYRVPRNPVPAATGKLTLSGPVGIWVNGVPLYDMRTGWSYSKGEVQDGSPTASFAGDGVWNQDAFVVEGHQLDTGNGHLSGPHYHYHVNPMALRHELGDSVDYEYDPMAGTHTYTENFNGKHSPPLGIARDGYVIYGPYGYDDPLDPDSGVRRMETGFRKRNSVAGTGPGDIDITVSGRTALPQWAVDAYGLGPSLDADVHGPGTGMSYPVGHYIEDYRYLGNYGGVLGTGFDLDECNGRVCVTPWNDTPTYCYFVTIAPNGTPVFPYVIGRRFYGEPAGGVVNLIPDCGDTGPVTTIFEAGPEKKEAIESITVDDPAAGDLTLLWKALEGGTYGVSHSSDLGETVPFAPLPPQVVAESDVAGFIHAGIVTTQARDYYRVRRNALAKFDDKGFEDEGKTTPITIAISGTNPAPPNLFVLPVSLTFNGVAVDLSTVTRPSQQEITFDAVLGGLGPGGYAVVAMFGGPAGTQTGVYVIAPEPPQRNVLLMFADDFGVDMSPIDNAVPPAAVLPKMPNLANLAANGLQFTSAHSQSNCESTRATILTGRQIFRHRVSPTAPDLLASEFTLPEAFAAARAPHALANFGKWHLGGGLTAFNTEGGWPVFKGINGGLVEDYFTWEKNSNGTTGTSMTYTTTDQVNEAIAFIAAAEAAGKPWFCWIGFNAPHIAGGAPGIPPYHDPPPALAPPGGYSAIGAMESTDSHRYRKMLEALDTEMGRLLAAIDWSDTNVIFTSDNGTPEDIVQAPYGPPGAADPHGKPDMYQGGIHVSMVVRGPDVAPALVNTDTDKLVHCVDLYATILELAGIDVGSVLPAGTVIDSNSIVPILKGTDTADRWVITEKSTPNPPGMPGGPGEWGRTLRSDDYPDYKLIIFGDPDDSTDIPRFELYDLSSDSNELAPLDICSLSGDALTAYTLLRNKDTALGGGYSDFPAGDILYLELPAGMGVPPLIDGMGNPIDPTSIDVDGSTATFIERVGWGAVLGDECDDVADPLWVKCVLIGSFAGAYTTADVEFMPAGGPPVMVTATSILVKP